MNILLISDQFNLANMLSEQLSLHDYNLILKTEEDFYKDAPIKDISLVLVHEELTSSQCFKLIAKMNELYRKGKKKAEKKPIFFLTKKESLENRIRALNSGASEIVELSLSGQLVSKIDSYLRPGLIWRGLKVLVVEDETMTSKYIGHLLQSKGASVEVLSDGEKAYSYMKENMDVDLILTDHMMPSMTGIDFIKKIRNELGMKSVSVIFISSIQDEMEILSFYKAGGNDYISKPIIKEEFFVKVGQIVNVRKYALMLKDQVKKLEEMDKLKDHLIAVCSHDLRGPLNVVLGLSNVMCEDENNSEDVREMSSQIYTSSTQLLNMVNDLLDLSEVQMQREKMRVTKINLCSLLNDILKKNQITNTKNIKFNFSSIEDSVFILGNESLLTRLFQNLLSNAYKFTGRDGKIDIRVMKKGEKVEVDIEDNGIGMPKEFLNKIFESMSGIGRQGTEGEKSTGIGMSIVKEIADNHGARVDVKSEVGVGTVFSVIFNDVK